MIAAVLTVIPVAAVVGGILQPSTDVWREQWDTRLPGEIWTSFLLVVGRLSPDVRPGVGVAGVSGGLGLGRG